MKGLLFFGILGISCWSNSQDTLIYRDGLKEAVKILSVQRTYVEYIGINTAENRIVISKSSELIQSVKYEDGRLVHLVYHTDRELPKPRDLMRNWVAIDLLDPFFGQMTISYQHTFRNTNLTLRVPLSTSFRALSENYILYSRQAYYSQNKVVSTGLDLMFFFNPKEVDGFLAGISYEGGVFQYGYENYNVYPDNNTVVKFKDASFNGIYLRGGYYHNSFKHIAFGIYVDLGTCTQFYMHQDYSNPEPQTWIQTKSYQLAGRAKFGLGYTF
ncbi:MAG: hypothetical protein ACK457_08125 [Flavobacteriia bacterium]|jgi:hypothetical protein